MRPALQQQLEPQVPQGVVHQWAVRRRSRSHVAWPLAPVEAEESEDCPAAGGDYIALEAVAGNLEVERAVVAAAG